MLFHFSPHLLLNVILEITLAIISQNTNLFHCSLMTIGHELHSLINNIYFPSLLLLHSLFRISDMNWILATLKMYLEKSFLPLSFGAASHSLQQYSNSSQQMPRGKTQLKTRALRTTDTSSRRTLQNQQASASCVRRSSRTHAESRAAAAPHRPHGVSLAATIQLLLISGQTELAFLAWSHGRCWLRPAGPASCPGTRLGLRGKLKPLMYYSCAHVRYYRGTGATWTERAAGAAAPPRSGSGNTQTS